MEAKELRIGNYVYALDEDFNESFLKVDLNDICNIECDPDMFNPVPLTEEILLKCGFEYKKGILRIDISQDTYLKGNLNNFEFHMAICEKLEFCDEVTDIVSLKPIKHLHQLQNLYFALTGKELEINL